MVTLNKKQQWSEHTSREHKTLVWINRHPAGPRWKVLFLFQPRLHNNWTQFKQVFKWDQSLSWMLIAQHPHGHTKEAVDWGECQGHVSAPRWELLHGVLVMLSTFFQRDKSYGENLLPTVLFLRWEAVLPEPSMGPLSAEISGHQRAQTLIAICNLSGRRASWVWKQWCPFA